MRGRRDPQVTMLAFVELDARVPPEHPLRTIKAITDGVLVALSPSSTRCIGKRKEAKLVFMAHALMENRSGMLANFQVSGATGIAERDEVSVLVDQSKAQEFRSRTLGGDKTMTPEGVWRLCGNVK